MSIIEVKNFNLNTFWEKTPTLLKYFLVIAIIIISSYFVFTDKLDKSGDRQLDRIEDNIKVTYTLIDNFEKYKILQDQYNSKILNYLQNLHILVEDLSDNTNRKIDMILKSNSQNKNDVIDKILILNESFDKLSKIYDIEGNEIKQDILPGKKVNDYQYSIGVEKNKIIFFIMSNLKQKKRWLTPQSVLVISIICLIFTYIIADAFLFRPQYNKKLEKVKLQYDTLHTYIDKKFPEIDSTLNIHSLQIKVQGKQIDELNKSLDKIIKK